MAQLVPFPTRQFGLVQWYRPKQPSQLKTSTEFITILQASSKPKLT